MFSPQGLNISARQWLFSIEFMWRIYILSNFENDSLLIYIMVAGTISQTLVLTYTAANHKSKICDAAVRLRHKSL